jgi:hypothetical protein
LLDVILEPHIEHTGRVFFRLGLLGVPFLAATLAFLVSLRRTAWHSLVQHFRFCISSKPTATKCPPHTTHALCPVGSWYRPAFRSLHRASLQHSGQEALSAPRIVVHADPHFLHAIITFM